MSINCDSKQNCGVQNTQKLLIIKIANVEKYCKISMFILVQQCARVRCASTVQPSERDVLQAIHHTIRRDDHEQHRHEPKPAEKKPLQRQSRARVWIFRKQVSNQASK